MYYVQRKDTELKTVETVAELERLPDAKKEKNRLNDYGDLTGEYYISSRACKHWATDKEWNQQHQERYPKFMTINEILARPKEFQYMLLGRLELDLGLDYGWWGITLKDHLETMLALYEALKVEPSEKYKQEALKLANNPDQGISPEEGRRYRRLHTEGNS